MVKPAQTDATDPVGQPGDGTDATIFFSPGVGRGDPLDAVGAGIQQFSPVCDDLSLAHARRLGRMVDRAAAKLPGTSKCLARAVALQWLLRIDGISSALVVAFRLGDRSGPDGYHAWTETCGEMLVGRCDRTVYRPIMALIQPGQN